MPTLRKEGAGLPLGSKYVGEVSITRSINGRVFAYLLIWLILSIRITHLLHDIILLLENVIPDTGEVGVLQIGIKVNLNDAVSNGIQVLLLRRTRSTVEDQENWLILLCTNGILDVILVLTEKFGVEFDIAGFVDTVDVAETSSDGEVWGDWRESLVDGKNILRLCVQGVVVNIFVVYTVLLTTGNTDLL
jgi:hypothetical protein